MTRKFLGVLLVAAAVPALQGCFPLAVTGVGAAALMASDRRTTGTYIEDESIEWKVIGRMRERFPNAHVSATSFNRRVLLTGQAPTEDEKRRIGELAQKIDNVRDVVNEITVGAAAGVTARGNDALITSNVKARMVNNGKFSPGHVKVLTEGGVVYLMGLVTAPEGEAAAEIARTTSGVNRVVKVFEYLN
jgi:osmotically-inducible protein OsmY